MTDHISKERRSANMRAVGARNTKPEITVRRLAHQMGYRFRLHRADLPGKPDLTFPKRRAVIFVHGCFWHGHDCKRGTPKPKNNADFWATKLARNVERDRRQLALLELSGWRALVVWECELKPEAALKARLVGFLG
ncbi:MAG: very short patch repair endonuclease [Phenylobacterium zucineum]|nr:MAG: very short patch repair endonuclease [Phenylobacterium zucineum]